MKSESMICLRCHKYIEVDAEGQREGLGPCQCPRKPEPLPLPPVRVLPSRDTEELWPSDWGS